MDPYPPELLDELPASIDGPADPLVNAITRLAQAIEALQQQPAPILGNGAPRPPALAPLPPVAAPQEAPASFDGCPIHHTPWKVVPAGISKKSGRPYESFRACTVAGCDQRPRL